MKIRIILFCLFIFTTTLPANSTEYDFSNINASSKKISNLPKALEKEFQGLLDPNENFIQEEFTKILKADPNTFDTRQKLLLRLKEQGLKSPDLKIRQRAAFILLSLNDNTGLEIVRQACEDKSADVRAAAITALGQFGDIESFELIVKHLVDKEPIKNDNGLTSPAQAAGYALVKISKDKAIEPLIKALDDKDLLEFAIKVLNSINPSCPEKPGNDPDKWKQWYKWYSLDSQSVDARIYSNWQSDPCSYTTIQVPIEDHAIRPYRLKVKKSDVMVIMAEDQNNPVLKELLKNQIFASYPTGQFQIPYFGNPQSKNIRETLENPTLHFNDALNSPIKDLKVELFMYRPNGPRIRIGLYKTDGVVPNYYMHGIIDHHEFIVSHPNYGTASIHIQNYYLDEKGNVVLPLVANNSQAASRAVWGYVVDPNGNPISNATISCKQLTFPGGSFHYPSSMSHESTTLTDDTGFFLHYVPVKILNQRFKLREGLVPLKSMYNLTVQSPDPNYAIFRGSIQNGKEATITIRHKRISEFFVNIKDVENKRFHKFEFYGQNGLLTDPEDLKSVYIEIFRANQPTIKLLGYDVANGLEVPNGTYTARFQRQYSPQPLNFSTIKVTDDSSQTLIFTVPMLTYTGKVLQADTNEPLKGVFVIAIKGKGQNNLSMLTNQQWQNLHALIDGKAAVLPISYNPLPNDPALKPLTDIYSFENIVSTDADGRYQMNCPADRNAVHSLVFLEQNYIGLNHQLLLQLNGNNTELLPPNILRQDENGVVQIPTKKMYPAATVFFQANSDKKNISCYPKWIISKKNNSQWIKEFLENENEIELSFAYHDWLDSNKIQSIQVPANTTLHLQLEPGDKEYDAYVFPQEIFLSQGQSLDIGQCEFKNSSDVSFYIKIVDSQGQPVDGVPVRKKMKDNYDLCQNADPNGLVQFWAPIGSKGTAVVRSQDLDPQNPDHFEESISFTINSSQDQGKIFILQLSDRMLELLTKQ